MDLKRIYTHGTEYVSYKDSYAYYFSLNCLISCVFSLVVFFLLSRVKDSAAFTRFRSNCPAIPIRSPWMHTFIVCVYSGYLLLISPTMAFLVLGTQDVVNLIITCLIGTLVISVLGLMTPARSPLPFLLSSMSLGEAALCLSQLIQVVSIFDYVSETSVWWIGFLSSLPFWAALLFVIAKYLQEDRKTSVVPFYGKVLVSRYFWIFGIFLTLIAIGLTVVLAGACVAPFGEALAMPKLYSTDHKVVNTRVMRTSGCPASDPTLICHVYLTAASEVTRSVFVNVHLPISSNVESVFISLNGSNYLASELALSISGLDKQDKRRVFSVFINNLTPKTDYTFTLISEGNALIGSETYGFRLPGTESVRLAIGGDAGVTYTSQRIMELMLASDPDLIVIGGDVAYDNGIAACACLWDSFLKILNPNTRKLVPLTFAVGNHDIGYNHDNRGGWAARSNPLPLLYAWFPHEVDNNGIPLVPDLRSMNRRHSFGNLLNLWILDSFYTVSPETVADFVDNSLRDYPSTNSTINMGVYHVPLYSINKADFNGGDALRAVWASKIFDKHKFVLNFENHSHLFKRTYPLVNSEKGMGTVYVGDGNMGVTEDRDQAAEFLELNDDRFKVFGVDFHFFDVNITNQNQVSVQTINPLGRTIDSFIIEKYGSVINS